MIMRVCYVLSTSEVTGGANRSALDMIGGLDRNRVEPVVLIKKHGDIEDALKRMDVPVYCIPFINEVSTNNPLLDGMKRVNALKTTQQVKHFLKEKHIQIVHNNSLPALAGMEAASQLGIPYVCHIREQVKAGLGLRLLNEKKHFQIVRKASSIIAISDFVCEEYKDVIGDLPIRVLHDGFNTSLYVNDDKTIFTREDVKLAIYGNLDPQKGQMDAIRAIEILSEKENVMLKLYIIGNQSTAYADEAKKYVSGRCMNNVCFMEPIKKQEDLKKSRADMDINLVCSSSEGLGRVTVESMLSGNLTIGARAGATPEIIRNGENGLLYECANASDLADKIRWAIENRSAARKIAENGRRFAKDKYSIARYAAKIQDIYNEISR